MRKVVLSLSMILIAASAFAAPSPVIVPGNTVRAQVAGSCLMPASFDLNFGAYDPIQTHFAADLDGSTGWTIRCTKNLPVTVSFNDGVNSTGALVRRMTNGTDFLGYQLYKNVGRTLVWGTGPAGGPAPGITGTGFLFTAVGVAGNPLTVFGRVPQAQDVSVGNYIDTIIATIEF